MTQRASSTSNLNKALNELSDQNRCEQINSRSRNEVPASAHVVASQLRHICNLEASEFETIKIRSMQMWLASPFASSVCILMSKMIFQFSGGTQTCTAGRPGTQSRATSAPSDKRSVRVESEGYRLEDVWHSNATSCCSHGIQFLKKQVRSQLSLEHCSWFATPCPELRCLVWTHEYIHHTSVLACYIPRYLHT